MTGTSHPDMRSGMNKAQNLVVANAARAEGNMTTGSPISAHTGDGDMDPDDADDPMLDSTEFRPRRDRHSKFVESLVLDPAAVAAAHAPEERAISWPAAPRSQPYTILQKRIEAFQRRSNRLDATRDEAFSIRMELKFLRSNYRQQHKFVDQSQRGLNDHVELMVRNDDFVTTRNDLLFLYGRARGDYLGLEDQSGKLQALEDRLTVLEARMKQMEGKLTTNSEKILGILRHLNPATRDEGEMQAVPNTVGEPTDRFSSEAEEDHVSSASEHLHPLLEEYWDKAGDVKVAKGRLIELLKDQEDRRVQRNHSEDQGMVLEISDADFNLICDHERIVADKAIKDAIDLRDKAKTECMNHGLNPEDYRHGLMTDEMDEIVDESTLVAGAGEFDPMKPAPNQDFTTLKMPTGPPVILTTTGPNGEAVVVNEIQPEMPFINESVERWIESVDVKQIDPALVANIEEPSSTAPSSLNVDDLRRNLYRYLARHGTIELFTRLASYGIDLPSSTKQDVDHMASYAKSTLSGTSRSSSESRIPDLLRLNLPHAQIIAGISEAARGRQR